MSPDLERLRIGAVDDHPIVLAGLGEVLSWHIPGCTVSPVSKNVEEFVAAGPQVDLVLLDIELHDGSDPAANVHALRSRGWPVILFTQDQRNHLVARAFRAGAAGLLSKSEDMPVIARAVLTVVGGQPYLSPDWAAIVIEDDAWLTPHLTTREVEAIRLYAAGMKLTSVARRLGVAEHTVRTYLLRARAKYEEVGRPTLTKSDLYIRALEDGLLSFPRTPDTT